MSEEVDVFPSIELLIDAAAAFVVECAVRAQQSTGRFVIALSGGSTPRGLYSRLATSPYIDQIDWTRVFVCWGDERCVPPTDPQSNYRMASDTLLEQLAIPAGHVLRMRGEIEPEIAALEYERELRALLDTEHGAPRIADGQRVDLVLLGLGTDGHTASLFPHGTAVGEETLWVTAEFAPSVQMWRLTLTPPLLNAAADVLFLAAGADKAEAVRRVLEDSFNPPLLPAQSIQPIAGNVRWMLDSDAADALTR
jgi:6-phosphogluconolactonase